MPRSCSILSCFYIDSPQSGPSRVVARDGIGNAVPPPVMQRLLSFYKLEERAVEEPVAKRRRA